MTDQLRDINEIAKHLREQDNHSTQDPIFCVQERDRVYGVEMDWCEGQCFLDEEGDETDEEQPDTVGYVDVWKTVETFLTEHGAKSYIEHQSHRHSGELCMFIESAYRNYEMKAIIDHLKKVGTSND